MIDSDDFDKPRVVFLPKWGFGLNAKPILKCEFGWNEETTQAFLSNAFQDIHLRLLPHQCMNIPALGGKALEVKCMYLSGSGTITGLEQFEELELISVDIYPKNGVKFREFTKLKHISTTWDKKQAKDIFDCQNLRGVDITAGFSGEDCHLFGNLPELRYLGFTQGRIKNLTGLEKCIYLESIGLAYARNFVDLGDLTKFKNLSVLSLVNLPKLEWEIAVSSIRTLRCLNLENLPTLDGKIELTGLSCLEDIKIVNCSNVTVDLSSISEMPNLQKLWLNVPHINLDLHALFSRQHLKMIGLLSTDELSTDDDLLRLASQYGRQIVDIERVGQKKTKHIRIIFQ